MRVRAAYVRAVSMAAPPPRLRSGRVEREPGDGLSSAMCLDEPPPFPFSFPLPLPVIMMNDDDDDDDDDDDETEIIRDIFRKCRN